MDDVRKPTRKTVVVSFSFSVELAAQVARLPDGDRSRLVEEVLRPSFGLPPSERARAIGEVLRP